MQRAPNGWGLNSLTAAFDAARENQFATFHNKPIAIDIVAIDRILWGLLEGHVDIRPMLPLNFFLRAHSCFRAAAACAFAGQVYEATVLQRATLEAAAYGLFIGDDVERGKLWFSRGDSKQAKENVRTEFGYGNLKRYFETHHATVAPAFVSLYETLIDFGAHPNEAGFSINQKLRRENRQKVFDTVYLHDDGLPLDFGLKNLGRVGLWTILAFRELYPQAYEARDFGTDVDAMVAMY